MQPSEVRLESDNYSPNAKPHGLPALHWPRLFASAVTSKGPEWVEEQLRLHGWDPQWRFSMYSQAHYHSTTHELLVVIQSSASVQLGGTDGRARPVNAEVSPRSCSVLELQMGDALLLPAGYTHRLLQGHSSFTMIGSYPAGSAKWDMRFPNVMGCPHDVEKIKAMVESSARKGLMAARSPDAIVQGSHAGQMDRQWGL